MCTPIAMLTTVKHEIQLRETEEALLIPSRDECYCGRFQRFKPSYSKGALPMLDKKDTRIAVPVFTVQTLPRKYELIKTIFTLHSGEKPEDYEAALEELAIIAGEHNADAVIGVTITPSAASASQFLAMGTAIKYVIPNG